MECKRWPYLCLQEEYSKNIVYPWKIKRSVRAFICIDWLNSCQGFVVDYMLHGYFPRSFSKKKKGMQLQFLWGRMCQCWQHGAGITFSKVPFKGSQPFISWFASSSGQFFRGSHLVRKGRMQICPAETRRFSALLMILVPEAADSPDCTLKTAGGFREHASCPSLIPTSGTHCFRLHLAIDFIFKHHLIILLFIMVKNRSQKLGATITGKSIQLRFDHIFIMSQDNLVSIVEESNAQANQIPLLLLCVYNMQQSEI